MGMLCVSLSDVVARRHVQGVAVALAKHDNIATEPDRPCPKGPPDESTAIVTLP